MVIRLWLSGHSFCRCFEVPCVQIRSSPILRRTSGNPVTGFRWQALRPDVNCFRPGAGYFPGKSSVYPGEMSVHLGESMPYLRSEGFGIGLCLPPYFPQHFMDLFYFFTFFPLAFLSKGKVPSRTCEQRGKGCIKVFHRFRGAGGMVHWNEVQPFTV